MARAPNTGTSCFEYHVTRSDQAQRLQLREARDVVLGVV